MAFVYLKKLDENKWFGEEQLSNSKEKRIFTFEEEELEGIKDMLEENGHEYLVEGELPYSKYLDNFSKFILVTGFMLYVLMVIIWVFFARSIWLILLLYVLVGIVSFAFTMNASKNRIKCELNWNDDIRVIHKRKMDAVSHEFTENSNVFYMLGFTFLFAPIILSLKSLGSFRIHDVFIFLPLLNFLFYSVIFSFVSLFVCKRYQFLRYEPFLVNFNG